MVSRRTTAVADTRAKLSDNARKLFDLAMQSGEFKKMMVFGMAVGAVLASVRFWGNSEPAGPITGTLEVTGW